MSEPIFSQSHYAALETHIRALCDLLLTEPSDRDEVNQFLEAAEYALALDTLATIVNGRVV